jgi:Fungal N-terminal domain of STAND proteins
VDKATARAKKSCARNLHYAGLMRGNEDRFGEFIFGGIPPIVHYACCPQKFCPVDCFIDRPHIQVMADPVSGIIGIIAVTAKVSVILYEFAEAVRGAPEYIRGVSEEVKGLEGALKELQVLVESGKLSPLPGSLPKTLESCRESVDQLAQLVAKTRLGKSRLSKTWNTMKWTFKEGEIRRLQDRIACHKTNIVVLLGTSSA